MNRIIAWIVDHPFAAILAFLAGLALLTPGMHTLELNADMTQFVPTGDPRTAYYEDVFKDAFGSDVLSKVVVKPDAGDVFTSRTLTLIQKLSDELEEIDEVTRVTSLTTVRQIRGDGDLLDTGRLITTIPDDPDELRQLRETALRNDHFLGDILSPDGGVAAIDVYTDKPASDRTFGNRFVARVNAIMAAAPDDVEVYHVGSPRAEAAFMVNIARDQVTVNLAAITVIMLFLWWAYRSPAAVLAPLLTTGLSVTGVFGFLSLAGFPITPYTALTPAFILIIGGTEDMHMLSSYFHHLRKGQNRRNALVAMTRHSLLPVTLTAFTTMVGFGALCLNEAAIIRQFGFAMVFGLGVNYLATVITLPAALRLLGAPKVARQRARRPGRLRTSALFDRIIAVTRRRPGVIVLTTSVLIGLALAGLPRLTVNNDFTAFFKADHPVRQDLERLKRDLAGSNTFNIVVAADAEGDILEPDVLQRIDRLQAHMASLATFGRSASLADIVKLMHRELHGGSEEMARIPGSRPAVAQYMLLLDHETVAEYVDSHRRRARIRVIHHLTGSRELAAAVAEVQRYIDDHMKGYVKDHRFHPLEVSITGLDYLMKDSGDAIVRGQVKSLGLALLLIFILMAVIFMSIKGGLIAIISNIIPILISFGVMGWFDIALDATTSMVALIALGIAIDDTLHFMIRYQRELRAVNDQREAMARAIRTEGEPVLFTSLALALGFAVIMGSSFVPSIYFGGLSALVMVTALLTDLFVNPVLLLTVQLITLWDYVWLRFKKTVLEKSRIFKDLRYSEAKKVVLLGSIQRAAAREVVCRQGEAAEEMYLVLSGRLDVILETPAGGRKSLDKLEPGDLFGEMALLGEGARTATVICAAAAELLRIDYNALERVRRRNPRIAAKLYKNIAGILTARVRAGNIA